MPRADRSKGGRPPFDHMLMFRILILQASHSLSVKRTEYLIKDRLSFMRSLGLSLADRVPDANSIWTFREALTRAQIGGVPAIEALFRRFDVMLSVAGYITIGGQIVDATVVAAPKQRNTEDEKGALKEGRIPEAWAQLPGLLDKVNTGSSVWADTAYRSAKNEAYLEINGFRSRIHRKKPQASRCRSMSRAPTPRSPRSAPMSSTSSLARRDRWRWLSAPLASLGRG